MARPIPKATAPPKIERVSNRDWLKGIVTAFDDGRTPTDGLRDGGNLTLEQDGTVRPRPSLVPYGPQPTGVVLGELYEFTRNNAGVREYWLASMQQVPQNEVQTLTITGTPTGGTFTLTYSGQTTTSIAYNASAATVQTALIALSNLAPGDVVCTGGSLPGTGIVITFGATLANTDVAAITFTPSLTGGTSPALHITETLKGGNTAYVYVAKGEDGTWTKCPGKEYNDDVYAHFLQFTSHELWVMNGEDRLSILDADTMTITPFVELTNPVIPTMTTNTGLIGTSFNVYFAVTSNSTVGETAGSPPLTVPVLLDRDLWNPDTQSIKITRTAVPNEQSWNVYVGVSSDGAGLPKLYAIATGLDPAILTFTDNGVYKQQLDKPLPDDNSTAGPRVTRGDVSNGRSFLVGDKDHLDYVWRGGDYLHEKDLSPSNGGGWTPVGGGKEVPTAVKSYRNGKGDAMVMILAQGTNGSGRRYYLNPENVTYGASTFVVWRSTEDSGQDGTDSPDGVIIYQNSAWYPSRDGFKTTGTKPQLQNILSTDKVSNTIQDIMATLNTAAMDKSVGIAYENRLYWAVPISDTKNSQILVLDLERKGAWVKWNIAADWLTLYNDNMGRTHFLALVNNTICELTYSRKTSDNGTTFLTNGRSGQVRFSEDGREWGRLIQLIYVLLRPQGTINFTVTGRGEDGELFSWLQSETFAGGSTRVGWSEPRAGWSNRGWSKVKSVPISFNKAEEEVIVEIDEDLQWYSYAWDTTESGVDYSLSEVVSEYVNIGIKDLS